METRRSVRLQKFLVDQLVNDKMIDQKVAADAAKQSRAQGIPLSIFLTQNNILDERKTATAISRCFELPLYDLDFHEISATPADMFNYEFVHKHYAAPILKRGDKLIIGIVEPNIRELRNISFLTCMNVEFILVEVDKLKRFIENVLGESDANASQTADTRQFIEEISQEIDPDVEELEYESVHASEEVLTTDDINDTPVVRFVNKVLLDAIKSKSSDIHFEPYEKIIRVRYRKDGILTEVVSTSKKLMSSVVARLKVMADLDITEHRKPQDGRFRLVISDNEAIDIRISTCPTTQGEKIVMRILDPTISSLDVQDLGMTSEQKTKFLAALTKPQGMILVTGPTGSGKTVSLYTGLQLLNTPEKNISTVEDPVEIFMHGVNQVQVNTKVDLTFASALRSFLRQDPDIIMVGEIRDLETAEIAIKASQTGHLVLSTLHTNSAPLTITRLTNMGIQAFNVISSVTLIMAQRLVRKLCTKCKKAVENPDELLMKQFGLDLENNKITLYEPIGCHYCSHGFKGRIALFELMPITPELNEVILNDGSAAEIEKVAKSQGMKTLRESGIELVVEGVTTIDEVNRITM